MASNSAKQAEPRPYGARSAVREFASDSGRSQRSAPLQAAADIPKPKIAAPKLFVPFFNAPLLLVKRVALR